MAHNVAAAVNVCINMNGVTKPVELPALSDGLDLLERLDLHPGDHVLRDKQMRTVDLSKPLSGLAVGDDPIELFLFHSPSHLEKTISEIVNLSELHTHLLGMGSADFWITQVILDQRKLPSNSVFAKSSKTRIDLGPLVWDRNTNSWVDKMIVAEFFDWFSKQNVVPTLVTTQKFEALFSILSPSLKLLEPQMLRDSVTPQQFSYDVIYSISNLAKSLGLDYEHGNSDLLQSTMEERFGINLNNCFRGNSPFHNYVIWNARDQKFQLLYGLSNYDLVQCLNGNSSSHIAARAHLRNAFSMCHKFL